MHGVCDFGTSAIAAKYCSKEYAKLRKIVQDRAYRGQAAAKQLIKDVDGLSSKEERLALLRTVVTVGEQGRAKAAKSAPWDPSAGWQVAGLGRRNFSAPVVVKSFRPRTMALKRTLCLYSFLREHGLEEKAPVPRLYKVVEIKTKKKDDEKGSKGGGKKRGGRSGQKKKVMKKTKPRTTAAQIPRGDVPGTVQLWFEYDAAKDDIPNNKCGLFRLV